MARATIAGVLLSVLLALPAAGQTPLNAPGASPATGPQPARPPATVATPPDAAVADPATGAPIRIAPGARSAPVRSPAAASPPPKEKPVQETRDGISKAWGERLAEERAAAAAAPPATEAIPERMLGVGTGPARGGEAPALSESDKICQRSLRELMANAEKGNAVAAFRVGVIYEEGCGVRRNRQIAAAYYELAGKNGHVEGAVRLGSFYAQGDVIGMDYVKARALLRGPAAKGHPLANFHLGVMAYRGDDSAPAKPDVDAAMKYFKAAAEGGFAQAQFIVGQAQVEGVELPKDLKAAKAMLTRASRQGFAWAMVILGRLHAEGEFADADPGEAFRWLMTAKRGNPDDAMLQSSVDLSLQKIDGKLSPEQKARRMIEVLDFKPRLEWEEKI